MANEIVREELRKYGMYQWQLAELCGVNENTLCRWFRRELPEKTKAKMIELIHENASINPFDLDVNRKSAGRPVIKKSEHSYEDALIRQLNYEEFLNDFSKKYLEV